MQWNNAPVPIASAAVEPVNMRSAARTLDLLASFTATGESRGVSEVSRSAGLSKATTLRCLETLTSRGFLIKDAATRRYSIGPTAMALGHWATISSILVRAARPYLEELAKFSGETVTLSAATPYGRFYVDQIVSSNEISMSITLHQLFPLHAGSSSKCILAFLPFKNQESVLNGVLPALTHNTITDARMLRKELELIRAAFYATSNGERQAESWSIATPLFASPDNVIGAMSICGPRSRISGKILDALAEPIVDAGKRLSDELNFRRDFECD